MSTRKSTLARLGLVIVFLLTSIIVFASLAEDVVNQETFSTIDPILGHWLITQASPTGNRFFSVVTFLGNGLVISIGTGIFGFWLAKRKHWGQLIFLSSTVAGAALLNLILKNIFLRPRPEFPQAFLVARGFSFPSGHAMSSLAFYGAVAYLACSFYRTKWRKFLIIITALLISGLIGFSRLYLGVHYFSDVLAGWVAGGMWLAVCILGDKLSLLLREKNSKKRSGEPT